MHVGQVSLSLALACKLGVSSMKRVALALTLTIASLALANCTYLKVLTFEKDESSGLAGSIKTQAWLAPMVADEDLLNAAQQFDTSFGNTLTSCGVRPPASAQSLALGGVLVGFAFDQFWAFGTSILEERATALAKASERAYSARILLDDPNSFGRSQQCIIFVRYEVVNGKATPQLALILQTNPRGQLTSKGTPAAIQLRPIFLQVKGAAAVTAPDAGITLVAGIALRSIDEGKDDVAATDVSLGSFTIGGVSLNAVKPANQLPAGSDFLALHSHRSRALQIGIAIVETGSELPDTDKAKAEFKALSEAAGKPIREWAVGQAGGS